MKLQFICLLAIVKSYWNQYGWTVCVIEKKKKKTTTTTLFSISFLLIGLFALSPAFVIHLFIHLFIWPKISWAIYRSDSHRSSILLHFIFNETHRVDESLIMKSWSNWLAFYQESFAAWAFHMPLMLTLATFDMNDHIHFNLSINSVCLYVCVSVSVDTKAPYLLFLLLGKNYCKYFHARHTRKIKTVELTMP